MAQQDGALKGVRVIDLGQFMAGPMAAMWLGDFGAEVIKIEHPRGDGFRNWGLTKDGSPLYWKMLSRNKQCATLNIGSAKGQDLLRELVKKCDVLIENFTPGTMKKWGLDYESLSALNPRLIMLSISAYGQNGPYADRPGFGTLAEALSGYAHITGQPDGPPTLPGFGLADGMAGLNGAFGILLALQYRHVSGLGQHIDTSLCEPLMTLLGPQIVEYDALGVIQERRGSLLPFSAPRNVYPTKDGKWLSMSSSAQSVFERTMTAIGRPDIVKDERFLENRIRGKNHEALDKIIGDWVKEHTVDEAMEILVAHEAAAAPVYSVADILTDPQFIARKAVVEIPDQDIGSLKMQAPTPRLSRTPGKIDFTGPHLGEHNREIYVDFLGLKPDQFDALKSEGVI